jgi:hypothetical protein
MKAITRKAVLAAAAAIVLIGAAAAFDPARIAGRYGHHFRNGLVDGSTYWSDDVLEIVKLGRDRAYLRAGIDFYNGHSCTIFGIAHAGPGGLVYRERAPNFEGGHCVLRVSPTRSGGVRLDDGGSCHDHCGARGSLDGVDFGAGSRRPIAYLARLRASSEFRDALKEESGGKRK